MGLTSFFVDSSTDFIDFFLPWDCFIDLPSSELIDAYLTI